MIPDRPEASVWLDIPSTCRMRGKFSGDLDIMIMFGDPDDGVNLLFKRPALERFVHLATELLSVPISDDPKVDLPILTAPAG